MSDPNPYAPPQAEVVDVPAFEQAPALWNPGAAASWSLLFSPIFGSYLHMKNWQSLGQADKAASSKNWIIGSIAFTLITLFLSLLAPESKALDLLSRGGGLGLLVGWYYSIGKSQRTYVLARFGKAYPRRGLGLPVLVALGILVAFVLAVGFLAVLLGAGAGES